jgi:hypothetical protein
MKLKPRPSYSYVLLLLIVLASCSKTSKVPVPADSGLVIHINGASLTSKLSWEEFRQGELHRLLSEEVKDDMMQKILDNPDSSGVDIKSDAYIFVKMRGRGGYAGFTCEVKDEKAFSTFMSKTGIGTPIKEGDVSVVEKEKMVFTWSNSRFVMIADNPSSGYPGAFGQKEAGNRSFPADSLAKFAREIYGLSGKQSIGSDKRFASLMKKDGDAHLWLNGGKLYGDALPAMLAVTKVGLLLEGNITAASINFENGKISLDSKSYYNKEMDELIKKYKPKNVDESLLAKLPSDNVNGLLMMNYPPEGLKAFLALLGVDGLINAYLAEFNYSIDEFVKANKGDLMIAATDFGIKMPPMPDTSVNMEMGYRAGPSVKFLFAASVNDQASFNKLMTVIQEKVVDAGVFGQALGNIPYGIKGGVFVTGNDSVLINSYGGNKTHPFASRISGHPVGGFIDIQKLISGFQGLTGRDSTSAVMASESLRFWQDAIFYGGEYEDDGIRLTGELALVDKNTNSLKQLHNYLGRMATIAKQRDDLIKSQWENKPQADSASILPK